MHRSFRVVGRKAEGDTQITMITPIEYTKNLLNEAVRRGCEVGHDEDEGCVLIYGQHYACIDDIRKIMLEDGYDRAIELVLQLVEEGKRDEQN